MGHIQRIAITGGADRDTRHVTVRHHMYRLTGDSLRLDVQSAMEMVGT